MNKSSNFQKLILVSTDTAMRRKVVMKKVMWGIKLNSMRSTIRLSESHEQVSQLPEVDLGERGHRHEVQSSDEVGNVRYQNDQHEKHKWIMKGLGIFSSGLDVKFFHSCSLYNAILTAHNSR